MFQYIFFHTSDRFLVFHGYRLTRMRLLLSVQVGIHHDSFKHNIEA